MAEPALPPDAKGKLHSPSDPNAPVPNYTYNNATAPANTVWEFNPYSPGSGYQYFAGLYAQATAPTGNITFYKVQEKVPITPAADGAFTYVINSSTHNGISHEYVLVVTRGELPPPTGVNHKVVGSATFTLTKV